MKAVRTAGQITHAGCAGARKRAGISTGVEVRRNQPLHPCLAGLHPPNQPAEAVPRSAAATSRHCTGFPLPRSAAGQCDDPLIVNPRTTGAPLRGQLFPLVLRLLSASCLRCCLCVDCFRSIGLYRLVGPIASRSLLRCTRRSGLDRRSCFPSLCVFRACLSDNTSPVCSWMPCASGSSTHSPRASPWPSLPASIRAAVDDI
jgi:hypothetical protein